MAKAKAQASAQAQPRPAKKGKGKTFDDGVKAGIEIGLYLAEQGIKGAREAMRHA